MAGLKDELEALMYVKGLKAHIEAQDVLLAQAEGALRMALRPSAYGVHLEWQRAIEVALHAIGKHREEPGCACGNAPCPQPCGPHCRYPLTDESWLRYAKHLEERCGGR